MYLVVVQSTVTALAGLRLCWHPVTRTGPPVRPWSPTHPGDHCGVTRSGYRALSGCGHGMALADGGLGGPHDDIAGNPLPNSIAPAAGGTGAGPCVAPVQSQALRGPDGPDPARRVVSRAGPE